MQRGEREEEWNTQSEYVACFGEWIGRRDEMIGRKLEVEVSDSLTEGKIERQERTNNLMA